MSVENTFGFVKKCYEEYKIFIGVKWLPEIKIIIDNNEFNYLMRVVPYEIYNGAYILICSQKDIEKIINHGITQLNLTTYVL